MSAEKQTVLISSVEAKRRHSMVVQSLDRLQHFAYRAKSVHNQSADEMIVICIKVDSKWRWIVDKLMPGQNWQKIRDLGQEPVALGTADISLCKVVAEILPGFANVLLEKPIDGHYKCVALDEGGATVYDILPIEDKKK